MDHLSSSLPTLQLRDLSLDTLPIDIHFHLFKYLDLNDIFKLRLISTRFNSIVKSYNITQLCFLYRKHFKCNWFSTTESATLRYYVNISKLYLLKNPSKGLLNLRYLRISSYSLHGLKVSTLNAFTRLQILEIFGVFMSTNHHHLKLSNLNALSINIKLKRSEKLIIDTPSLHSLCIEHLTLSERNKIKFKHSQSVKYLKSCYYDDMMIKFKNLECIEFTRCKLDNLDYLLESNRFKKLQNLKKLKKLKFNYQLNIEEKERKKDKTTSGYTTRFLELLKLKKDDLEIVLNGVKIDKIEKIGECYNNRSSVEFQLDNYGQLEDDLYFVEKMNYNNLMYILPANQSLSSLFEKYTNIQLIEINGRIEDENRLINFISQCRSLNSLQIRNSYLSLAFYDRLPLVRSLLMDNVGCVDNFKFIAKMYYLNMFETTNNVQLNKHLNLNSLKYLEWFSFRIKTQRIKIKKEKRDKYDVYDVQYKLLIKNLNLNKLIKYTNDLRDN